MQLEWTANPDLAADLSYSTVETCPACGSAGTLEGEDSTDVTYEYDEDDPGSRWATISVPADHFSCSTCHLVLDRYELIEQADLPGAFAVVDEDPAPEYEYGND